MNELYQRIGGDLGVTESYLRQLARSAPYRYSKFKIPKRSGTGERLIAQPAKEVKRIQRWLLRNDLSQLPMHDAATAYRKGAGIAANARPHANNRFLLKMDFRNFFPSIMGRDFE